MHAYTFFSTVILCHLSEEGIQIILTLHSEDILKIFFLMYILRCSYSVIEGDLIIRKPSNLASGLKITAQHTILHDSKPVSLRTPMQTEFLPITAVKISPPCTQIYK